MGRRLFRVYELANLDRSEVVVGIAGTETAPGYLLANARKPGWEEGDRVSYRALEDCLTMEEAADFAVRYSESGAVEPASVFLGPDIFPPQPAA